MSLAWSERFRAQVEKPFRDRHVLFSLLGILIGFPCSLVWAGLAAWRMSRRVRAGSRPRDDQNPWIVSVGNVAVGGTGKSPIVRALARCALRSGYDVAVLLRGYGKEHTDPLVSLASDNALFWNGFWSDESLEHALALRSARAESERVWIAQGRDRQQTFRHLCAARSEQLRSTQTVRPLIVLLDDGLSQISLPVHHDVVVWDPLSVASAPRACLPFGPYRMGWPGRFWAKSLPSADVVIWSRLVDVSQTMQFDTTLASARLRIAGSSAKEPSLTNQISHAGSHSRELIACEKAQLMRVIWPEGQGVCGFELQPLADRESLEACHVLTGLARPQRFIQTLRACVAQNLLHQEAPDLRIIDLVQLADHGALNAAARSLLSRSQPVVTSLKDVCRWWSDDVVIEKIKKRELFVLTLDVRFLNSSYQPLDLDFVDLFGQS